jgi:hypothetical protein
MASSSHETLVELLCPPRTTDGAAASRSPLRAFWVAARRAGLGVGFGLFFGAAGFFGGAEGFTLAVVRGDD